VPRLLGKQDEDRSADVAAFATSARTATPAGTERGAKRGPKWRTKSIWPARAAAPGIALLKVEVVVVCAAIVAVPLV